MQLSAEIAESLFIFAFDKTMLRFTTTKLHKCCTRGRKSKSYINNSFVTSKRDVKTRKTEASTNLKDSRTIHVSYRIESQWINEQGRPEAKGSGYTGVVCQELFVLREHGRCARARFRRLGGRSEWNVGSASVFKF